MCRILYISNPTVDVLVGEGWRKLGVGGPAYYGAWAAHALGCRDIYCLGVVGRDDAALVVQGYGSRGVSLVARVVEGCSTRFRLDYTVRPRRIVLECWPGGLLPEVVVEVVESLNPDIVVTSPVYSEVPLRAVRMVSSLAAHHLLDIQGFVRSRGIRVFGELAGSAPYIHVSSDDVWDRGPVEVLGKGSIVVYTKGVDGVDLLVEDGWRSYDLPRIVDADPTGSGDVFSTAFIISVFKGLSPEDAVQEAIRITADFLEEKLEAASKFS